ncbi:hypothetical protein B0J14DRAFT_531823 [Halenospora varia]|nr:hypothetical protein B0J14DRAFT_531823 [Halenospora varia]
MAATLEITGNVRDRFIQAAALLRLLDPVRGEPTAYGLDQESHDGQAPRERLLKRKFLDSFALICATRKDGDTVSAACLEEGGPEGTVVRIASNAGVSEDTLSYLRDILGILSSIAIKVLDSSHGEAEVLLKIIRLDITKIRQYVKALRKSKNLFGETIPALESRLVGALPHPILPPIQHFLDWFGQIFSIQDLPAEPDPDVLLAYIRWAQKAKKTHLDFLKVAFSNSDQSLPRWVCIVFKLGRYGIAARALVQIANEIPALFNPIIVKSIPAPRKARFSVRDEEMPLTSVLRRVPEIRPEETLPRLAGIWNTTDAESLFRRSCSVDLVTHAELQIINFYDHNPQQKPRLRFIGVSKKSCYLCFVFLAVHPENFCVSSCHQKLYLSWIPPPAVNPKVYKQYKAITVEMSKRMEAIARQELVGRLGSRRYPVPADSTAGVSLSGLTESRSLETTDFEEHDEIEIDLESNADIGEFYFTSQARATDSHILSRPVKAVSPMPQIPESQPVSMSGMDLSNSGRQFPGPDSLVSISSMVFHFRYLCDKSRQDIITISSVLDPHTHSPAWSKLVELLNPDDNLGLVFKDSDVLMVNNHIRVRNERQFIACLQYLLNSGVLNSEVMICDSGSTPHVSSNN